MHLFRTILLIVLTFALPFQAYALVGAHACAMSHAPMEAHSHHAHASEETDAASNSGLGIKHHGVHGSAESTCQCSASCIGTGLMSEYPLVELRQERPVYAQVHSVSVLQAPIKRLDRPPRYRPV